MEKQGTVTIHKLSHEGRGIGRLDEKIIFIEGTLPDETVEFEITKKHSRFYEGKLLKIVTPNKDRVIPPCSHFGTCGGCNLQHLSTATQLELKWQTLLEQLKHFGQISTNKFLPPLSAGSIGYRRKARLGVKFVIKKNKVLVGFREKSSRFLADLKECIVLHPKIGKNLTLMGELVQSLGIFKQIPQIEVAMGDEDAALIFRHLEELSKSDYEKLLCFGREFNFHIYSQPNAPDPIKKIWPQDNLHYLSYSLSDPQLTFKFHPLNFTQINLDINRLMVKQALNLLNIKKTDLILDLFCGIGNFSLPLAKQAKHVIGIEGCKNMQLIAQINAEENKISNVEFHTANLIEPIENVPWLKKVDKVLLDPPRTGALEFLPYFKKIDPTEILYISCNTATLTRDAKELDSLGYELDSLGIIDMFPHTRHVESMALFKKRK